MPRIGAVSLGAVVDCDAITALLAATEALTLAWAAWRLRGQVKVVHLSPLPMIFYAGWAAWNVSMFAEVDMVASALANVAVACSCVCWVWIWLNRRLAGIFEPDIEQRDDEI